MKRFLFFFIIGLLFTGCSEDETPGFGSIYGIVTDADTHQPIYGASVILSPSNLSTTTGQDGHYEFTDLEPGQYKIQIQANNYQTNSRQIQVNAGGRSTIDMTLTPTGTLSNLLLSASTLDFDTGYSELTLSIRNVGNAGTVSWYISEINESWLSVSPQQGKTAMGQSSEIKVTVDRSKINTPQMSSFVVNTAESSQRVTVSVNVGTGGGNGGSGGTGGNTGDDPEDYSSATVATCDYRVEAAIVSCKRSGSSVVFTYTLTNTGLGYVNDFRIYPPSAMSVINGGTRSSITDSEGNEYPYPTMTFRSVSTTGINVLNTAFPENIECKGTVTIKDVPAAANSINALIGVYAYPNSTYNMADNKVVFSNVPIY